MRHRGYESNDTRSGFNSLTFPQYDHRLFVYQLVLTPCRFNCQLWYLSVGKLNTEDKKHVKEMTVYSLLYFIMCLILYYLHTSKSTELTFVLSVEQRIRKLYLQQRRKTPTECILCMTLNLIWWCGSSSWNQYRIDLPLHYLYSKKYSFGVCLHLSGPDLRVTYICLRLFVFDRKGWSN